MVDKELHLDETTSLLLRLLDEYGIQLHALLAKITLRGNAADELLQELFLKVRTADGFATAPSPEKYLTWPLGAPRQHSTKIWR